MDTIFATACVALAVIMMGEATAPIIEESARSSSTTQRKPQDLAVPANGETTKHIEIPDCGPSEFLYWVLQNRDDGGKLHIEVTPLKGGDVEAFDVSKPGHALYERHYRKGALVCRALPLTPAGG